MALNFKRAPQILDDMVSYLAASNSALTDFNIGSATRSLLEVIAVVVAEIHWLQESLILRFFVVTATGQWLDRRADEVGLTRVAERATTRVLEIAHADGAPEVLIPAGKQFRTQPGSSIQVVYEVTSDTTLPAGEAMVEVPVVSTANGAATAIPDGTALAQTGAALAGIDTIITGTVSTAGLDQETDAHLRERVLARMRSPIGPGSKSDLRVWALEVDAVEDAIVLANWDGDAGEYALGHATVMVLGPDHSIPDGSVIAAAQDYLDPSPYTEGGGKAAVGARIHVIGPTAILIDVTVTVTPATGYDPATVRANVQANIEAAINGLGIGETVKLALLGNAVWDTDGVHDGGNYSYLRLRRGTDDFAALDVALAETEKPTADSVVVS